ncbi:MAG: ATP-binding cassette domain-containing protein [Chloroflexaceae bacterium]|nr:ATP-binding cassette domain-containing protein [Chloroflexaceae bacterium]
MTATLRIQDGLQQREVVLPRTSQPITLGRASDNDIVLYAPFVSAYHAQLIPAADGTYQIVDCASMNGILFGGQRLGQAHTLADGDTLRIGDPRLGSLVSLTYCNPHHARATPIVASGVSLDAAQVSYQIGRGVNARTLLHPTTLSLSSGMLVAIIGASGAGKSTLLKALCGYQPATAGQVLLNGHDLYANWSRYRSYLGYVPQEDTLHSLLTVGQALHFTVCLRLPDQMTAAEREARITRALTTVDLLECRHQRIAELSGGQRKRAAIAAELLIEPALLFLDEPASGLDPGLEQTLMYTLRQIADAGCGVVLVTHATENIMQCDQVVLLAQGYPVYRGPPADALNYFELDSLIFADVYSRVEGNIGPEEVLLYPRLKAGYAAWQQAHPNQPAAPAAVLWAHALQQAAGPAPVPAPLAVLPHTGWWQQARTLVQRVALLKWQDRRYFWLLVLQAPLIGLVVRWLTPPDALLGTQAAGLTQRGEARELLFTLVLVGIWGGLLNAAREFASNPAILRHDRFNGVRASAAFAARFVLLAGFALLQVGMLLGVVLSGVPLPPDAGQVLPLALEVGVTLLLASLAATALGLAVSASAAGVERAMSSVPLLLVAQIIFAGMIFPATHGVAAWLAQVTISRPAVDALGASLDLNTFCDLPNDVTALGGRPPVACSVGTLRWRPDPAFADAFTPTADHVLHNWRVLGVLLGLGVLATMLLLWQQYIVRRIPVRRLAPTTASLVQLSADDMQPEQPSRNQLPMRPCQKPSTIRQPSKSHRTQSMPYLGQGPPSRSMAK